MANTLPSEFGFIADMIACRIFREIKNRDFKSNSFGMSDVSPSTKDPRCDRTHDAYKA